MLTDASPTRAAEIATYLESQNKLRQATEREILHHAIEQADALGLTAVHVNRMIQAMRRDGDLDWKSRRLQLRDPSLLAHKVGRSPVRVTRLHPARGPAADQAGFR